MSEVTCVNDKVSERECGSIQQIQKNFCKFQYEEKNSVLIIFFISKQQTLQFLTNDSSNTMKDAVLDIISVQLLKDYKYNLFIKCVCNEPHMLHR
jgi:hypothetical protein